MDINLVIGLIVVALVASCYSAGFLHGLASRPQVERRRFRRPGRRAD